MAQKIMCSIRLASDTDKWAWRA